MNFYKKHSLDYKNFRAILSSWRGEEEWQYIQQGYPVLVVSKQKGKKELHIFKKNEESFQDNLIDNGSEKLKIQIDEYSFDLEDKGW